MAATSSTAARNAASFAFEGLLKPLIFLTYWSEAARTSSAVTGGSKLNSILIFRHIPEDLVHGTLQLDVYRGGSMILRYSALIYPLASGAEQGKVALALEWSRIEVRQCRIGD